MTSLRQPLSSPTRMRSWGWALSTAAPGVVLKRGLPSCVTSLSRTRVRHRPMCLHKTMSLSPGRRARTAWEALRPQAASAAGYLLACLVTAVCRRLICLHSRVTNHGHATGPNACTGIAALPCKLGRPIPDLRLRLLSFANPRSQRCSRTEPHQQPSQALEAT